MKEKLVYGVLSVFIFVTMPLCAQESSPTDEIVVKAANAVIFQMTANLKLTQDQVTAVEPIIAEYIAKERDLQQSLEDGMIDSSTMYVQREQLSKDENLGLSSFLSADQMKAWMAMQDQSDSHSKHSSSK